MLARVLIHVVLCLFPFASFAFDNDFDRHGADLRAATSQNMTAAALRGMADAAAASNDKNAALAAQALRVSALAPGLGHAFNELAAKLRAAPQPLTPQAYKDIVTPILREIIHNVDIGNVDTAAALRLGDQLLKLDKAATGAGLPGLAKVIDTLFGTSQTGGLAKNVFAAMMGVSTIDTDGLERSEALEKAMRARTDAFTSIVPTPLVPSTLILPLATGVMRFTGHMFDHSSEAMGLVTKAIRTGRFDEDAFQKIRDKIINTASRGPWDNETFKDLLIGWCKQIPQMGKYCSDIYREVKYAMFSAACRPLDCDCDNVQSSFYTQYRAQCQVYELEARLACAAAQTIILGCRFPFGPAASPKP